MKFFAALFRLSPILLLLPFSACSKDGENARATMIEILTADGPLDDYLSQDTKAYYKALAETVVSGNARKAKMVGDRYDCPYTTLETFYAMGDWSGAEDSTALSMDGGMIDFYLRLSGAGVYAAGYNEGFSVSKNVNVRGRTAEVEMYVPTGVDANTKISTNYILAREGDNWKLNIASTFEVNELLSKQLHRRQKGSIYDFAQTMVEAPPETIRFQYRAQ